MKRTLALALLLSSCTPILRPLPATRDDGGVLLNNPDHEVTIFVDSSNPEGRLGAGAPPAEPSLDSQASDSESGAALLASRAYEAKSVASSVPKWPPAVKHRNPISPSAMATAPPPKLPPSHLWFFLLGVPALALASALMVYAWMASLPRRRPRRR